MTMFPLKKTKSVHFIGIGGIGMQALARVMHSLGFYVTGSDLKPVFISEGIECFEGHSEHHIRRPDWVVISAAIKDDNPEVLAAKKCGCPILLRGEVLAHLARLRRTIAVTGTHGKTTTSCLITYILTHANWDPGYLVGGKLKNHDVNGHWGTSEWLICESDESELSFTKMQSEIAVLTNLDKDHMESYQNSFDVLRDHMRTFLHQVPFFGFIVACIDDATTADFIQHIEGPLITYGLSKEADVYADNVHTIGMRSYFSVFQTNYPTLDVAFNLPGPYNIRNALAAITVARLCGVNDDEIISALSIFPGVERRFDYQGQISLSGGKSITVLNDYAHHPREIAALHIMAREAYPGRRLVAVFQPHRYSRTQYFLKEFALSLSCFDLIILLPVFSAGEKNIPGTIEALTYEIQQLKEARVILCEQESDIYKHINDSAEEGDICLMVGAGSIVDLSSDIAKFFANQQYEQI